MLYILLHVAWQDTDLTYSNYDIQILKENGQSGCKHSFINYCFLKFP